MAKETQLFEGFTCGICGEFVPLGDWVNHKDDHADDEDNDTLV